MAVHETDICIIGGGITSAMLAQRLAELRPGVRITVVEAGTLDLRRAEPRALSRARDGLRRAPVARRLHRGSAGQRHHLDDDGGRRAGAALGRRVQPVLRGGPAAEVDVRPGDRLADRMAGARTLLLRGRAAAERQRRAEPASGRSPLRAIPAGADPALLQPADAEGVGRAERREVFAAADGAQPDAVRRPRRLLRLRHLRRGLSVRRALLARLHVPAADRAEEDRAARSHAGPAADRSTTRGRPSSRRRRVHQDRPGRSDRVPREDVRRRVGLLLELASAAAVGERAVPRTASPTAPGWSAAT